MQIPANELRQAVGQESGLDLARQLHFALQAFALDSLLLEHVVLDRQGNLFVVNYRGNGKMLELGVRPEFVKLAPDGIPVDIVKVLDAGRYQIVESRSAGSTIKLLVREGETVPQGSARVRFAPDHTRIYQDGWVVT